MFGVSRSVLFEGSSFGGKISRLTGCGVSFDRRHGGKTNLGWEMMARSEKASGMLQSLKGSSSRFELKQ